MSSTSTTWTTQGNTKAGISSTTSNNVTIGGDLTLSGSIYSSGGLNVMEAASAPEIVINADGDLDHDAALQFSIDYASATDINWQIGIDESESGAFKISKRASFADDSPRDALKIDEDENVTIGNGSLTVGQNTEERGILNLWDGGGTNTPGYIAFAQPDGNVKYVWVNNDGDLMINSSVPTDSGGTIVGTQSS